MRKKDFDNLTASIRQAGKIRRGEMKASRVTEFAAVNVKAIRQRLGKSQVEFARMIGVSVATLQNWEQGRRDQKVQRVRIAQNRGGEPRCPVGRSGSVASSVNRPPAQLPTMSRTRECFAIWLGVVAPLVVHYVLDEERRLMAVLRPPLPLPRSGLQR